MRGITHGVKLWLYALFAKCFVHKWALLILIGALLIHFWYIFLNFTTALYGGPGDHTASLIWLYEQSPNSPWWGFTNMSAAPFGEMLWTPVYLLGQAIYIIFWIFSSIFQSGIGGYNAITIVGYVFSFISIYYVATKLFERRPLIVGIYAYIGAFTPFVMALNTVGHLSYIFAPGYAVILAYETIRAFTQAVSLKRLLLVGALSGLSWLIDPYYVLFSTLLVFGLGITIFFYKKMYSSSMRLKGFLKRLTVVLAVWLACMTPLIIYSQFIASTVSSTTAVRADIRDDAQQYSARFIDFLLPSIQNPLVPKLLVDYKNSTFHGKDTTFTLYSGITLLIFLGISFSWYLISRQTRYRAYIVSLIGAAFILFLFSLPPVIEVLGFKFPGLSGLIVAVTSTWRVFARIFIFAFPLLILAAIGLSIVLLKRPKRLPCIMVSCVLIILPLDMLYRNPFNPNLFWSMKSNISTNYQILKRDSSIKSLAEYPLREAPHYKGSLYFTAQLLHGKRIVNPMMVSTGEEAKVRRAIVDLNNPQTVPALKFLDVDAIQVWSSISKPSQTIQGASLLATDSTNSIFGQSKVELYRIKSSVKAQRYVVYMQDTGQLWNDSVRNIEEETSGNFGFTVLDLCKYYKSIRCNEVTNKIGHTILMDIFNDTKESIRVEIVTTKGNQSILLAPGINSVEAVTENDLSIRSNTPLKIKNYRIGI